MTAQHQLRVWSESNDVLLARNDRGFRSAARKYRLTVWCKYLQRREIGKEG